MFLKYAPAQTFAFYEKGYLQKLEIYICNKDTVYRYNNKYGLKTITQ